MPERRGGPPPGPGARVCFAPSEQRDDAMTTLNRAELQALLVGAPLPAQPRQLAAYARSQGAPAGVLAALERLGEATYRSLQDVGEELAPAQPAAGAGRRPLPRPESGGPPGGERYTA
jgi:Protein of unknown function (DUF2795)